jgi:hypothetical protein
VEQAARAFESGGGNAAALRGREIEKLHAKIGELVAERDFLARGREDERSGPQSCTESPRSELACGFGCGGRI